MKPPTKVAVHVDLIMITVAEQRQSPTRTYDMSGRSNFPYTPHKASLTIRQDNSAERMGGADGAKL